MSPGGFSSFHATFEFSVASANATNETALRAAVLAILAAEDLDVDSAAVSVTYNVTTTRRRLHVPPAPAEAQPLAGATSHRRLQATVTVIVEVTLPSEEAAVRAKDALVKAVSDANSGLNLAVEVEEVLKE